MFINNNVFKLDIIMCKSTLLMHIVKTMKNLDNNGVAQFDIKPCISRWNIGIQIIIRTVLHYQVCCWYWFYWLVTDISKRRGALGEHICLIIGLEHLVHCSNSTKLRLHNVLMTVLKKRKHYEFSFKVFQSCFSFIKLKDKLFILSQCLYNGMSQVARSNDKAFVIII